MAVAAHPALTEAQPRDDQLSFTGEGSEYFRIWIVNLALSVVTLGIYSPWAKVRRLQYFYRHTRLAGSSFDFHGDPIAILRGRLVGALLFGGYALSGLVSPLATLAMLLLIGALMPWLLARSFRFRCHNTSYRGVRFGFLGTVAGAYNVFLGLPLLAIPTLGLLAPFAHHRMKQYQYGNATFGAARFSYAAPVSGFYLLYLIGGALMMVIGVVMSAVVAGLVANGLPRRGDPVSFSPWALALFAAVYIPAIVAFQAVVWTRLQTLVWEHTTLPGRRVSCALEALPLFGIMFTNLLLIVLTLGCYRPYAAVRQARYVAQAFTVVTAATAEELVAAEGEAVGATGEETAELFGFDMGF
jgi:uncharacterized membrane protein YjgN (DUF898 family)